MTTPNSEQALYFGPEQQLFGHFHRAQVSAQPARGAVLLCAPWGNEAESAHASWRQLAQACAKAGQHVLRFDLAGTGHSAGDDAQGDELTLWLDSVRHAIDALKALSGCEQVTLVGMRLGALLAHQASVGRADVRALAALVPVVRARSYIRELRALGLSRAANASSLEPEGLNAGGFALSGTAVAQLSELDLSKLPMPSVSAVLVIDRDDLPAAGAWVQAMRDQGVSLTHHALPGYVELMGPPHSAVPPLAMFDALLTWLASLPPVPSLPPQADTLPLNDGAPLQLPGGVRERAVHIEADGVCLHGVLTEPASQVFSDAVVLLNAGATRAIGPNRLHVGLARDVARQGFAVLRVDQSGLGDSPAAPGHQAGVVYSDRAVDDVRIAVDWLRQHTGLPKVQLAGLCSGAYHTFLSALSGMPLRAATMINPLTFRWEPGMSLDMDDLQDLQRAADAAQSRKSVADPGSWMRVLRGETSLLRVVQGVWAVAHTLGQSVWTSLKHHLGLYGKEELGAQLHAIAQHGIPMHFVFATNDPGLVMLRSQAGAMVGKLQAQGKLTLDLIDGADHTFTDIHARERLKAVLRQRLLSA